MKKNKIHELLGRVPPLSYAYFDSYGFRLLLLAGKLGLFRIIFLSGPHSKSVTNEVNRLLDEGKIREGGAELVSLTEELQGFFSGKLTKFRTAIDLQASDFRKRVLKQLIKIPYGETATYSDVARAIGSPAAARAVGQACNQNPLPIIIPCHRVLGKNGNLTGYAPGIIFKKKILQIEKKKR